MIGQMPRCLRTEEAALFRARCSKPLVPKLQQASQSPGELVIALITGPVPAFLVQKAWFGSWESAYLTIPGDMEAAGLGTTLGAYSQHHCSKQSPDLQWAQLLKC